MGGQGGQGGDADVADNVGAGGEGGNAGANYSTTATLLEAPIDVNTLTGAAGAGGQGAGGPADEGGVTGPAHGGYAGIVQWVLDAGAGNATPQVLVAYMSVTESPLVSTVIADTPAGWGPSGKTLAVSSVSNTGPTLDPTAQIHTQETLYAVWQDSTPPPAPQPGSSPEPAAPFADVPLGAPFEADIAWLKTQKITSGFADGSFHPTASITREAVAAFLYREAHDGKDAPAPSAAPYSDVPVSNRFAGDIAWLKTQKITSGFADGGFHPTAEITRAATAAFLYRQAHDGKNAGAPTMAPFTDVPATSPFAGDIAWLKAQHITDGFPNGSYRPGSHITREAAAAFLYRAAND